MKSGVAGFFGAFIGTILGAKKTYDVMKKSLVAFQKTSQKHLQMFQVMNRWVELKQQGFEIPEYLSTQGCRKVAVYGMHHIGERLLCELKNSQVEVAYGIDRNSSSRDDVKVVKNTDELEPVDMIIVTAVTFFEEIKQDLQPRVNCPVVSLEDILYDMGTKVL